MVNHIKISRRLCFVLRHDAINRGLELNERAMVPIEKLLEQSDFTNVSFQDIKLVCEQCKKQRFIIDKIKDKWYVGATQGHSFKINNYAIFEKLTPEKIKELGFTNFIHGTFKTNIESIKRTGLSKMSRQHIHITPGYKEDKGIISGYRSKSDVLIFLDVCNAINDGFEFFLSKNGVVLTEGDCNGYIPVKYISNIVYL